MKNSQSGLHTKENCLIDLRSSEMLGVRSKKQEARSKMQEIRF